MKTFKIAFLMGLLTIMLFLIPGAVVAEICKSAEDHEAMAASYMEKVKVQEAIIQEHEQMKKDYEKELTHGTPKLRRFYAGKIDSMKKHCNAIIQSAWQLADEYRKFANWHKMRAAELKDK